MLTPPSAAGGTQGWAAPESPPPPRRGAVPASPPLSIGSEVSAPGLGKSPRSVPAPGRPGATCGGKAERSALTHRLGPRPGSPPPPHLPGAASGPAATLPAPHPPAGSRERRGQVHLQAQRRGGAAYLRAERGAAVLSAMDGDGKRGGHRRVCASPCAVRECECVRVCAGSAVPELRGPPPRRSAPCPQCRPRGSALRQPPPRPHGRWAPAAPRPPRPRSSAPAPRRRRAFINGKRSAASAPFNAPALAGRQ